MRQRRAVICVMVGVCLASPLAADEPQPAAPPGGNAKPAELSKLEQDVVDRTNAERKKANLPLFAVDPALMTLAREHTANMARLNQLSHELGGKSFVQRLQDSGYRSAGAGENIAQGQRTPAEALVSWMNSPGHKTNLLNAKYTRIGVGIATSAAGSPYYTQIFATPLP